MTTRTMAQAALDIVDRGTVLPLVVGQCPHCPFQASALNVGRVTKDLAAHLVKAHWPLKEA